METDNLKNFCYVPFLELDINTRGFVKACCISSEYLGNISQENLKDIWNNQKYNNLRKQFINNEKPTQCSVCWVEEQAGFVSKRMHYKKYYEKHNLIKNFDNNLTPISLVLNMGNVCNLSCRMCSGDFSTTWQKELIDLNMVSKHKKNEWSLSKKSWDENNQIWNVLEEWLPNLKLLSFVGGEPMLLKPMWNFLKNSVDKGYSKNQIITRINTNSTIYEEEYIEILNEFKKCELHLSIDGIDKVYDYIRYPARWEKVKQNIKLFFLQKFDILVTSTISVFNILYLKDICDYFQTNHNKPKLDFNLVHFPKHLCIQNLPISLKEVITNNLKDCDSLYSQNIHKVLDFMNKRHTYDELGNQLKDSIKIHDNYRNQKFEEYLPELAQFIK